MQNTSTIAVDGTDCWVELGLSGRFKRALRRDIVGWLVTQIETRGFRASDPALFDQDRIEGEAERIADRIVNRLENNFRDQAPTSLADCEPDSIAQWLDQALAEELGSEKQEFAQDDVFGVDFLMMWASDAPITIHQPDSRIHPGTGFAPDDEST